MCLVFVLIPSGKRDVPVHPRLFVVPLPLAPICFLTPKLKNAASIANCNGTNLVKTFFTYTEYTSGVKILFSFGTISCIPVMVIFVSNIKMHAK